ncbi:MAG: hypothetical protein C5B60_05305 [Chloroflexi bacterium]|nr:MAG: hypothetical protein C5B60_05305 [Chloroflexota bacterium]
MLFVAGVIIEHTGAAGVEMSNHQETTAGTPTSQDADAGHHESTPTSSQEASANSRQRQVNSETTFGLDLENPGVVAVFVLIWLGLLISLLRLGRIAWAAVFLVALASLVLDIGEVGRQISEGRSTIVVVATLVAIAHGALAALAVSVLVRETRGKWYSLT